jgi:hypothetical protein
MKARYHLPTRVVWRGDATADEKSRLERMILRAIENALKSRAGSDGEIVPPRKQPG